MYNQLLSSALSGVQYSVCTPNIASHYPAHEYAHFQEHEVWQSEQEFNMGPYGISPSPSMSPADSDLLASYPRLPLPPATPHTPLPNLDIAFDLPLPESCLLSCEFPETCSSHKQSIHHNVHDESSHTDVPLHHFRGNRSTESSLPTDQSWSNARSSTDQEELTPSPAYSPSPKAAQKKLTGVRAKCMKEPSKPKPRELKSRRKAASNLPKPLTPSDWSSDGIEETNASNNYVQRDYGSKNLVSERKRRIKLNEKLFSLRALVPRISKMDKASIVADAIDYVKDLHEQLKSIQDDILVLQAGTYVPTKEGLRVHAQLCKQANIPQYKIVEMHVSNVEPKMYHLRIHCKKEQGLFLQLTRVLEALTLQIVSANLATVLDLVISTITVKAGKVSKVEDFEEELKKSFPTYGLYF